MAKGSNSKQQNTDSTAQTAQAVAQAVDGQAQAAQTAVGDNPLLVGPTYRIRVALQKAGLPAYQQGGADAAAAQRGAMQLTQAQLASGMWVKVATCHVACVAAGVPVARMVKAFGGDRGFFAPLPVPQGETSTVGPMPYTNTTTSNTVQVDSHFTVRYAGRTRYMPASCLTLGIAQLASMVQ